ncbi:hypothetical protein ACO1O0_000592 [Amphichorda felina]
MPQSLRSILGQSNRVRKPTRQPPRQQQGTSLSPSPRKTSASSSPSPRKPRRPREDAGGGRDIFEEKLDDVGAASLLVEDLTLRDVVQAMRYIRAHMFTPVPERGIQSTRTTELLNYRVTMPPIVTVGHLHAVLNAPTRTERETAELLGRGVIRRVRIDRRGGQGEALIETSHLEDMVRNISGLSDESRERFTTFLRGNPTAQTLPAGTLSDAQADELIRAGFLTSSMHGNPGSTLHIRPEDRTTLMSIQRISRHASGSLSAVGGPNAIHLAGGGGGGGSGAPKLARNPSFSSSSSSASSSTDLKIAIPGHGRYLKLAAAGIDWIREALGRTKWGECPESWLKERFEGGGLYGPRWKEFWGVEWEWVLGEAMGLGVVEMFETKSVGRGVRALGG